MSGKSRFNNSFHRKFDMQIWFAWLHVCLNLKISETSRKAATSKKTSSGNWKSGAISDKLLLNSANFRFCRAIGALFIKGVPLEFAILKYFPSVGLLSHHRVKFRRHEAHNDSSPNTTLSLTIKHSHTSS